MNLATQCLNQEIACMGLIAPLFSLTASIVIAIVGFPRLRTYLVSDLEEGRDHLFRHRKIDTDDPGFDEILNIIVENTEEERIEPYTHQDNYRRPMNLFDNIEEIEIQEDTSVHSQLGERIVIRHGNPPSGAIPLYDVGSPLAISNWINTKIENIQYRIIVLIGFPLLLISFGLQTIVYWYTNIS